MFKKIALIFLSVFIKDISYGIDSREKVLDLGKNKVANDQLFVENNQDMLDVEIPRRMPRFDSIHLYSKMINECKKECCNCNYNCKENVCFCGLLCISFTILKCFCG